MPRVLSSARALAVALALVPMVLAPACAAPGPEATVISVGDGDTIRVRMNGKPITVRLDCIDAPEMAQRPYGQNARQYLQQRLPVGSTVTLDEKTTDRYGRLVAEVFKDININLVLVEDGQAFAYRQYLGGCDAREYLDAEYRASRRRYGVRQVKGGITRPWDFRRGRPRGSSAAMIPDDTTPDGRRYSCSEIGSYARAQELLRQGHTYLDSNRDGEACDSLRR
jgi:endonuclease YncB( thermonuclease family)